MTKRALLWWWRIQLCQQELKMSEASSSAVDFADGRFAKGSGLGRLRTADNFDGLNAVKSEAARFLARFQPFLPV